MSPQVISDKVCKRLRFPYLAALTIDCRKDLVHFKISDINIQEIYCLTIRLQGVVRRIT